MEKFLTPQWLIAGAVFILLIRYGLLLLDHLVKKWIKGTTTDHGQFVTFAHCKVHRDNCLGNRAVENTNFRKDLSTIKKVLFHIGRAQNVDDRILEPLVGEVLDD